MQEDLQMIQSSQEKQMEFQDILQAVFQTGQYNGKYLQLELRL